MNLRVRILTAITGLVLASLTVLLLVGGSVIGAFSHGERTDTVTISVDTIEAAKLLNEFSGDADGLAVSLAEHGYSLVVLDGDTAVYSSAEPYQHELYNSMSGVDWSESASALEVGPATVLGIDDGDRSAIAITLSDGVPLSGQPPVVPGFRFTCLLTFIPRVLLCLLFTNLFLKSIMRPLNELADAARRIERGDLSKPVLITGHDEFSEVCETFNNMQLHLGIERDRNKAYEKARTDLVSGISHDLRTPLTAVKGCIQGLRDGVASTPERRERYLDVAYARACDMETLLARLLDFSRLETGNIPLELRECDLGEFAAEYASQLCLETADKPVSVETEIEPGEHRVRADTSQMRRVLSNMADNSLKYARVSPLKLRISVYRDADGEHIRFSDNGRGVPRSQLRKIFDEFWRGDEARSTRNVPGSGLGLHIVKFIVESHGGSVRAMSDGGFAIDVCLPYAGNGADHHENPDS